MFPHETGSSTSSGANSPAPGSGSSLRTRTLMAGAGGRPATYGSRTLILDPTETYEEGAEDDEQDDDERHVVGVLHVEGATRPQRRIQWSEEVVDNEHLGRKKSKICCIFKKTREFGESSDESSSDSSSDDSSSDESDSGGPNLDRGPSRPARKSHDHGHDHDHNEGDECGHHHHHEHGRMKKKKKPVLNSYERMPKGIAV
ncbi:Type 1 phosphatases regulator ypi1 [Actinomortierella wolfii]|nr:Type 1 phosphatases regulator ypi1 [Actinomortierella wolfii]